MITLFIIWLFIWFIFIYEIYVLIGFLMGALFETKTELLLALIPFYLLLKTAKDQWNDLNDY